MKCDVLAYSPLSAFWCLETLGGEPRDAREAVSLSEPPEAFRSAQDRAVVPDRRATFFWMCTLYVYEYVCVRSKRELTSVSDV